MDTKYDHEQLQALRAEGLTWLQVAEEVPGATAKQLRQAHNRWTRRQDSSPDPAPGGGDEVSAKWDPGRGRLSGKGREPLTLDQLMEMSRLDPEDWEVKWCRPGYSEVGAKNADGELIVERLFNLQARLQPIVGASAIREVRDRLIEEVREAAHVTSRPWATENPPDRPHLAEVVLFDIHLGMLAWRLETGTDYDMRIADRTVRKAVEGLLDEAAGRGIEEFLLPLGNDFFHTDTTVDGKGGATTAGTPQDVDSRWQKAFWKGQELMVWTIRTLLEIAPVRVLVVPGNHDEAKAWYLGEVVRAVFAEDPNVVVDNRPLLRKYHAYGNTLIGFTHGKDEKVRDLPMIMAQAVPELWGRSRFREFHMGHLHAEIVREDKGFRCRHLPALTATDAWHFKKGFVGNDREARLMLWSRDRGRVATFHHTVVPPADEVERLGPLWECVGTPIR